MAGPDSPPFKIASGVSRIRSASAVLSLWQARHLFFSMGRISRSKSTEVRLFNRATGIALVADLEETFAGSDFRSAAMEGTEGTRSATMKQTGKILIRGVKDMNVMAGGLFFLCRQ